MTYTLFMNSKYLILDAEYLNPSSEYEDENLYSETENKLRTFIDSFLKFQKNKLIIKEDSCKNKFLLFIF